MDLINFGKCESCGQPLYHKTLICRACKHRNQYQKRMDIKKTPPPKKNLNKKSLDDVAYEAHMAGMSYGDYVAKVLNPRNGTYL